MHFDLFAVSVLMYYQGNLLHAHPSAVVGYVYQVLSYAKRLMEADCGAVFIWSVFIAAVEVYLLRPRLWRHGSSTVQKSAADRIARPCTESFVKFGRIASGWHLCLVL
jgi:hypothetical protein